MLDLDSTSEVLARRLSERHGSLARCLFRTKDVTRERSILRHPTSLGFPTETTIGGRCAGWSAVLDFGVGSRS